MATLSGISSLLPRFSLYPDRRPKDVRVARVAGTETERLEVYKSKSSAYKDNLCSCPYLCIPLMSGLERSAIARGSMARANSECVLLVLTEA